MKTFILLIFASYIFLNFNYHAQSLQDLKKYSYVCFSLDTQNHVIHSGVCYFYKNDSTTILLTNYHIISGINTANDSVEYQPV